MSIKPLSAVLCALLVLAGCAQFDELLYGPAKSDSPSTQGASNGNADVIFINPQAQATGSSLRNVYIAPANLANMQVIQPEGAAADAEWWIDDNENQALQSAITYEFAVALGYKSAFNIVHNPAQADIVLHTAVVAIHPNEARGSVARRTNPGGAITVSIVLINAASGQVMVRFVNTRASDDIWAFNQVKKDDPALNPVFRAWAESVRNGLLQAQGRPAL